MKQLNNSIKKAKDASAPREAFKKELMHELETEWDVLHPKQSILFSRLIAIPLTALALFISTGVGAYAYSSDAVTEGDFLFPVKTSIEQVELFLARHPEARARVRAKILAHRLEEARTLRAEGTLEMKHLVTISLLFGETQEDIQQIAQDSGDAQEFRVNLVAEMRERMEEFRALRAEVIGDVEVDVDIPELEIDGELNIE